MASDSEDMADEPEEQGEGENIIENKLTMENAGKGLSLLCKTASGLSHAYVRLDVHEKKLTDVSVLDRFKHLRYVDVSNNYLTDISALGNLPNLLTLNAEKNKLETIQLQELPYLQVANFSNNSITALALPPLPALEKLILAFNKMEEVAGLDQSKFPSLRHLDVHGNLLTSTTGVSLPSIEKLYLASNRIKAVEGIESMSKLTTLHLRDNQIEALEGFPDSLDALQYLNLRGNPISELSAVGKLKALPMLRALILVDCPVAEMDDFRVEVLIHLRKLERLDKEPYTSDERADAEEISEQRKAEEEGEEEQ